MTKGYHRVNEAWKGGIGWGWALIAAVLLLAPNALAGQERIDERRPLASDGRLDMNVVTHGIRVESWDRNEVHLTGTIDPSHHRLVVEGNDRALRIRIEHEGRERSGSAGTLELRVPRGARLSLGTVSGALAVEGMGSSVRLNTVSGAIRLNGSPESAELHTVSGGVQANGEFQSLQVHSVSGDIRASGVTGRLSAHSVSGRVRVEGSAPLERLQVNSVSGGVEVEAPFAPGASVSVESHSGNIVLRVPSGMPADYELSSFSGTLRNLITNDEPRTAPFSRTLHFVVGDGSSRVRLATFSGTVTIEPLNR